jgi:hypothetical protein
LSDEILEKNIISKRDQPIRFFQKESMWMLMPFTICSGVLIGQRIVLGKLLRNLIILPPINRIVFLSKKGMLFRILTNSKDL